MRVCCVEICTECVAQRQCVCESVSLSHCKAMPHRDRQQGHIEERERGKVAWWQRSRISLSTVQRNSALCHQTSNRLDDSIDLHCKVTMRKRMGLILDGERFHQGLKCSMLRYDVQNYNMWCHEKFTMVDFMRPLLLEKEIAYNAALQSVN